jgi:hypothetical protein
VLLALLLVLRLLALLLVLVLVLALLLQKLLLAAAAGVRPCAWTETSYGSRAGGAARLWCVWVRLRLLGRCGVPRKR